MVRATQYVLHNVLVLLYIIIELFGIQSHGFLSVVLVLFSFSCCCRGFTACATGYVYYIMFFLVVFRFVFRARVRCCCLLGLVCGF